MNDPCGPLPSKAETPKADPAYCRQVADRLDEVLAAARRRAEPAVEGEAAKIVIFSDHHKGARDGADDFQRCERAYSAALGYYLEAGFKLFVLGDAEELWEENPEPVLRCYGDVLGLEAAFAKREAAGLERFFGNHDDLWQDSKQVDRHLSQIFPGLAVREALLLPLTEGGKPLGELFFVHGHQGTTESDKYGRWARLPVRYLWRPLQRRLGYSATTPASDFRLRGTHDLAMFEWARGLRARPPLVLVAGHTHRPVFSLPDPPSRPVDVIAEDLDQARAGGDVSQISRLRAELEHAKAIGRDRREAALTVSPPCYFNTGCCSFPDGDITGIEIESGEIRLVRWPDDEEEPRRRQLGCEPLSKVFAKVANASARDVQILEVMP